MSVKHRAVSTLLCVALAGCGTYVPSTREWPNVSDRAESDMIATIVSSVACELSYTVTQVIDKDRREAKLRPTHKRYTDFLFDWGVEVAINITVVERSSVNPTVLLMPPSGPSSIFTLAGGLSGSAEATRLQKMNVFYTIGDLYKPTFFDVSSKERPCRDPKGDKQGSLLVDNDLRLSSLLEGRIDTVILQSAQSPEAKVPVAGEKNLLSQTVSFKILSSGTVTPAWKLVRANVNPSGNLFSTGRDRTHELVFTFGPLDKSVKGKPTGLVPVAEMSHLNTQLETALRGATIPLQ